LLLRIGHPLFVDNCAFGLIKSHTLNTKNIVYQCTKNGILAGLLTSIKVSLDVDKDNNILTSQLGFNNCHWSNKFLILDQPLKVEINDLIIVNASTKHNKNNDNTIDYHFNVKVVHV
jgi:hypothetical protein